MELSVMSPVLNQMGMEEALKYWGATRMTRQAVNRSKYPMPSVAISTRNPSVRAISLFIATTARIP